MRVLLFLLIFSQLLMGVDQATFSNIKVASGSGCPNGTVGSTLSPDGTTLSVLFDSFFINLNGGKKERQVLDCILALDVQAPQGKRVVIRSADIRGYIGTGAKTHSQVSRRFVLIGAGAVKNGGLKVKNFNSDSDIDYFFDSSAKLTSKICGGKSQLLIQMRLDAKTLNKESGPNYTALDSLDLSSIAPDGGVELIDCKK